MKKVFKTLIYLFIIFISIIVFNYKSSVIEVETEVKGKMQTQEQINSCLNNNAFGTIRSFRVADNGKGIDDDSGTEKVGNQVGSYSQGARYWAGHDNNGGRKINKVVMEIYDNLTGNKICGFSFEAGKEYAGVTFPPAGSRAVYIELDFGTIAKLYGVKELNIYSTFYNGNDKVGGAKGQTVKFRSSGPAFSPNGTVPQPEYTSDGRLCFSTQMAEDVSNFGALWGVYEFNPSDSYPDPKGNPTNFAFSVNFKGDQKHIQTCSDNKIDISKVYKVKFINITDAFGYGNTNESGVGTFIHPNTLESHTTTTTEPQTSYNYETTTKKNEVGIDPTDDALDGFEDILGQSNLSCDSGFSAILDEAWKIILICAPILTMLMGTIDFVQALVSSNAEGIKKASSGMIKRAVALLLLMLLKVIISIILNLFGITICF